MRNHLDLEELLLAKALTSQLIRHCDTSVLDRILEAFDKEIENLRNLQLEFIDSRTPRPDELSDRTK